MATEFMGYQIPDNIIQRMVKQCNNRQRGVTCEIICDKCLFSITYPVSKEQIKAFLAWEKENKENTER